MNSPDVLIFRSRFKFAVYHENYITSLNLHETFKLEKEENQSNNRLHSMLQSNYEWLVWLVSPE